MLKKKPKHSCTLFLDDIREEVSGKISLIGLYGLDLVLGVKPPVIIPKLCIMSRIFGGEGSATFKFSFKDPDGKELVKNPTPMKMDLKSDTIGNLNLVLSPFPVSRVGKFKFTLFLENEEFYTDEFEIRE